MNKAMLKGRLGQNPQNNKGAVKFTVATTERWNDKKTGETQERTEWHNVVFFGKVGEVIEKHLTKGSEVLIEGSINTNKWKDKEGNDRYTTQIVGSTFEFCGTKSADNEAGNPVASDNKVAETQEISEKVEDDNSNSVPF